jgi:hypothetical protein
MSIYYYSSRITCQRVLLLLLNRKAHPGARSALPGKRDFSIIPLFLWLSVGMHDSSWRGLKRRC